MPPYKHGVALISA